MAVRRTVSRLLDIDYRTAVGLDHPTPPGADGTGRSAMVAQRIARRVRGRHLLVGDLVGVGAAALVALWLRSEVPLSPGPGPTVAALIVLIVSVRLIVGVGLHLYSRDWRYASVPELQLIMVAVILGSLVAYSLAWLTSIPVGAAWPRVGGAFWVTELLLSLGVIGGSRFAIRSTSDLHPARSQGVGRRGALLYGAGRTGVLMARSAQRSPDSGVVPVGFLDDDPRLAGGLVAGIRVYGGLDVLRDVAAATGARTLIITMPSAPGDAVRRVVDTATELDLEVRTVPSMIELLDGSLDVQAIRRIRVEDLLGRPMVTDHATAVEEILRDRTVMITGAGGSIGSELARQVQAIGPRRLIVVDRAESPLYMIERELQAQTERSVERGELRAVLANVASRASMERLFAEERPSVVFHAAAYKQVPVLEDHPSDAVQVNIGGTTVLLEAALATGVDRFVFVSTDKAVRPSSVMGASKRIAELLVASAARRTDRPYVSVRFGNVLGSTGSVIPIFQEQLEHGAPLTITHPDMTRFFMTIQEAAWLILDAAALGHPGGDLFVLDMGRPVRIVDLANDLVRLAGRDPARQPMKVVGLRPGEKLHEQLFYEAEEVEATSSPKVLRVGGTAPPDLLLDDVRHLLAMADGTDEQRLRDVLVAYAGGDGATRAAGGTLPASHGYVAIPVGPETASVSPGLGA